MQRIHSVFVRTALAVLVVGFIPSHLAAQIGDTPCELYESTPPPGNIRQPPGDGLIGGGQEMEPVRVYYRPWAIGVFYTHTEFDEFEGEDLSDVGPVGVANADLDDVSVVLSVGLPMPNVLTVSWPVYLDLDWVLNDGTDLSAKGKGDITVYGRWVPCYGQARAEGSCTVRKNYAALEYRLTLPTGDDEDALGFPDWTGYAGVYARFARDVEQSGYLQLAFTPSFGYHHNSDNSELDAWILNLPVLYPFDERNGIYFGVNALRETGDGRPAMPGDPNDVGREPLGTLSAYFNYLHYTPEKRWLFSAGLSRQLIDDGLREEYALSLGATYRFVGAELKSDLTKNRIVWP